MIGQYISIDNDQFEFAGKEFLVHDYKERSCSTAVELTLEDKAGLVRTVVVPKQSLVLKND